jgi:D-proline reductase (dithiol) PrdB
MQKVIFRQALELLESALGPRTTVRAPYDWREDDPDWRSRYGRVDPAERDRLLAVGEARRQQRAERAAARSGDA